MNRHAFLVAALLGGALAVGACSEQSPVSPSAVGPAVGGGAALAASHTSAPLQTFPAGPILSGTSSLTRNGTGISMTVKANDLNPGHAYTVWFVIFNDPGACVGGCGVDDVLANRGVPSLRFGAGHVIGGSGQGNFGGQLAAANTGGPACAPGPDLGSCGPGLLDSRTAVIHLVVRSHGQAIPELVSEQISSFGGGCQVNACGNVQFAEHLPPS